MFLASALQTDFLIPKIILLGIASVTTIFVSVFKLKFLPTFVIEIIIGLFISRWFNKYISVNDFGSVVDGIYVLGLSFIMFLSGYDAQLEVIKDKGDPSKKSINIFKICIQITLLVLILSVIIAIPFSIIVLKNKSIELIALLGIVFSSCFAGIVSPLIHEKEIHHSKLGKVFAVFADISELLSLLFLSIFMVATGITKGYVWIMLIILSILIIWKMTPIEKIERIFGKAVGGFIHLPTRIIILLIFGLTILSEMTGAEYVLGAYIAGIFAQVTGLKGQIFNFFSRIVYGVFAPMFFIIVGTKIDIFNFFNNLNNIIYLIAILGTMLIVRLPMLYLLKWFKAKTLIPMILLNTSTIIVCIAAQHIGSSLEIFSIDFGNALVFAGIITSIITPIIFSVKFMDGKYDEKYQIKFND